ncbi:PLP-dependent aminotransferase family protein [Eubacteriales bacterium KG127]
MKPITIELERGNRKNPIYIQLYKYLRSEIVSGNLPQGYRLPPLRQIAKEQKLSLTTVELAYGQLAVEGYIESKPQSGFYVAEIPGPAMIGNSGNNGKYGFDYSINDRSIKDYTLPQSPYISDPNAFDFKKWRKVVMRVLDLHTDLLMQESDPQGEAALRYEISKYILNSRGVKCQPEQIIIGAGTQQITGHIGRLLKLVGIKLVCTEEPGYLPVRRIFKDQGLFLNQVPVTDQGINIDILPNSRAAVYVCPNNQFPTGAVMPIGRRYRLLEWARNTNSIIIEDDYDSELRYFGRPISSMQGLESDEYPSHVIYLGSFSATLFSGMKISYMVLPEAFMEYMEILLEGYTQTCSKTEQMALAYYMEDGHYYTNIKKLRNLCGRKLSICLKVIDNYDPQVITADHTESGLNIILRVSTNRTFEEMEKIARDMGVFVSRGEEVLYQERKKPVIFYYSRLPENSLKSLTKEMIDKWIEE